MDTLSPEIIINIIKYMDTSTIRQFSQTNKYIHSIYSKNKNYIFGTLLKNEHNVSCIDNELVYYLLSRESVIKLLENSPPISILRNLLHYKTKQGETLLMLALRYYCENENLVNTLLDMGISIQGKDIDNYTPLMLALKYHSSYQIINRLLDMGVDIHGESSHGHTPLMVSLKRGGLPDITNRLLDMGASIQGTDHNGYTLLMIALELSSHEIINRLLDMGISVQGQCLEGDTPLKIALQRPCTDDVINRLLDMGASVQGRGYNGYTSLIIALDKRRTNIVHRLLDMGADIHERNDKGKGPLDYAHSPEILARLRAMGATET